MTMTESTTIADIARDVPSSVRVFQQHGIDFDRGLTVRDRGVGWSVEKMLEDHMYWALIHWRWMDADNYAKGPRAFFKRVPGIMRP